MVSAMSVRSPTTPMSFPQFLQRIIRALCNVPGMRFPVDVISGLWQSGHLYSAIYHLRFHYRNLKKAI
jgi:hypothetical protein